MEGGFCGKPLKLIDLAIQEDAWSDSFYSSFLVEFATFLKRFGGMKPFLSAAVVKRVQNQAFSGGPHWVAELARICRKASRSLLPFI